MEETIFTKIIKGEIPANKVFEDDKCLAFLDINPVNIGHTLVIPKKQFKNLYELPDDLAGHIFSVAKKISISIKKSLGAEGVNIIMNNDVPAGQIVFHAHLHVIPRYSGDGFEHWRGKRKYNEGEADLIAKKITEEIK